MFTNWKLNRMQRKVETLEETIASSESPPNYMKLMTAHKELIEVCSKARVLREKHPENKKASILFEHSLDAAENVANIIWHN